MIENMKRHPRKLPELLAAPAAAAFAVPIACEGFISRRSVSRSVPALATV
jgi:hypothetical protein